MRGLRIKFTAKKKQDNLLKDSFETLSGRAVGREFWNRGMKYSGPEFLLGPLTCILGLHGLNLDPRQGTRDGVVMWFKQNVGLNRGDVLFLVVT